MAQVDSNEVLLPGPEVIARAAAIQSSKLPVNVALVAIAREIAMPNTEVKQFGNTVFITHFSKDRDLAVGRALNMDTAANFITNGADYLRYLKTNGTTKFVTEFAQKSFRMAFEVWLKRKPVTSDMKMWIFDVSEGKTQVRIALEGDLI
jgi:hypothetical protein